MRIYEKIVFLQKTFNLRGGINKWLNPYSPKDARYKLWFFSNKQERIKFVELRGKAKKLIKSSKISSELHGANWSNTNSKEFYSIIMQKSLLLF